VTPRHAGALGGDECQVRGRRAGIEDDVDLDAVHVGHTLVCGFQRCAELDVDLRDWLVHPFRPISEHGFLQSRGRTIRMTPCQVVFDVADAEYFLAQDAASPLPRSFGRTRNCTCGTGTPKIVKVFTSVR